MIRSAAAIAACLGLASCAFTPQERFVANAYDYNLVIEQTQKLPEHDGKTWRRVVKNNYLPVAAGPCTR